MAHSDSIPNGLILESSKCDTWHFRARVVSVPRTSPKSDVTKPSSMSRASCSRSHWIGKGSSSVCEGMPGNIDISTASESLDCTWSNDSSGRDVREWISQRLANKYTKVYSRSSLRRSEAWRSWQNTGVKKYER